MPEPPKVMVDDGIWPSVVPTEKKSVVSPGGSAA
jgi:hypothetical protein